MANIGGMLEVDAIGTPSITPVFQPGNGMATCDTLVLGAGTVFRLTRSSNVNPVSICLNVNGTVNTLTVGTSGSLVPPHVTWTPDTGTPGGQIGPLP